MASFSQDSDFNDEELTDNDGHELEVLPTELLKSWPGPPPLIFREGIMRRLDIVGKIRIAFLKRRPFQSRFAIELYFDTALENQLLIAWNILKNCNIKPTELRPHITLTTSPFAHQSKLEKILDSLALNQKFLPLYFSSIGPLKKARSPTQSNPLLRFHSKLYEAMTNEGIEIGEKYRPGSWVPFCIVAEKVPGSRMEDAKTALRTLNLYFSGYAVEIRLVEFMPKPEPYLFSEEGATFLFSKQITLTDATLNRFSVPKAIAENETYFPRLALGGSIDIEAWDPESGIWDMVLTRYMNYTFHIGPDWKMRGEPIRLVAGDVILFYKLKRENVFVFPYQYMIRFERANQRGDGKYGFDRASSGKSIDIQDNNGSNTM